MKYLFKRIICPLFAVLLLSNCSSLAPGSFETAFKYIGYGKTGADAITLSVTGKTTNDHMLSYAIGKDCKISRVIRKQPICVEIDPKVYKYKLFNKGKLVSADNVVKMEFPSEIYDFNNTLEKKYSIKKAPKKTKNKNTTKKIF